jgi:hypothetical protein
MRTLLICAVICTVLAGCAGPELQIPKEVSVAVPTACVDAKDKPLRPQLMTRAEILALDDYRRTLAIWGEWLKLTLYTGALEPVVDACSRITDPKLNAR